MSSAAPSPIHDSPTPFVREHIERYVATNGEDGHLWRGLPCLLVTVKGKSSGKWTRSALIYGRDGDDLVLIASKGGAPDNPVWLDNMLANPDVWLQVVADQFWATAHVVDEPTERARLWSIMKTIFPQYDEYEAKAAPRVIPVVRLVRRT